MPQRDPWSTSALQLTTSLMCSTHPRTISWLLSNGGRKTMPGTRQLMQPYRSKQTGHMPCFLWLCDTHAQLRPLQLPPLCCPQTSRPSLCSGHLPSGSAGAGCPSSDAPARQSRPLTARRMTQPTAPGGGQGS